MNPDNAIYVVIAVVILVLIGIYVENLAPFILITVGIGFAYLLFKEGREVIVNQEEDRKREVDNLKDEIEDLKKQRDKKI